MLCKKLITILNIDVTAMNSIKLSQSLKVKELIETLQVDQASSEVSDWLESRFHSSLSVLLQFSLSFIQNVLIMVEHNYSSQPDSPSDSLIRISQDKTSWTIVVYGHWDIGHSSHSL